MLIPRFSVRFLLLLILLAGIGLALLPIATQHYVELRAHSVLRANNIPIDETWGPNGFLTISPNASNDEVVASLLSIGPVSNLVIYGSGSLSPEGLRRIGEMSSLKTLHIYDTANRNYSYEWIPRLQGLQALLIGRSNLDSSDLKHIGQLSNLQSLRIQGSNIDDSGVQHLASLKKLRFLELSDCDLTDACLQHFKNHRGDLYLCGTRVTDEGIQGLHEENPKARGRVQNCPRDPSF